MTTAPRKLSRVPAVDRVAQAMTEQQLQDAITGMCDHYRIKWHHETDSRKSKSGFPDLVLCGRRVAFWELKSQGGRVRPEQNEWLTAIVRAERLARTQNPQVRRDPPPAEAAADLMEGNSMNTPHGDQQTHVSLTDEDRLHYDSDPKALAWATEKLVHERDRALGLAEQQGSDGWKRYANLLTMRMLGFGKGCVITPFDHRLALHDGALAKVRMEVSR